MKNHSIENKEWRKRNPEKVKAHIAINNAIRNNKIIKHPCVECGCVKSEAHHEDYNKPLSVIWLCRKCHVEKHRKNTIYIHKLIINRGRKRQKQSLFITKYNQVKQLKEQGLSYREIAIKLEISISQVYKIYNNTSYH